MPQKWISNSFLSGSVRDLGLEILCVSQFTLYHVMKGNKLDFHLAMGGDKAKDFYEEFLAQLRDGDSTKMLANL